MRLKRLELCGFKSFVDKTVLRFEPGLTAIVGPNGCGKSNVVDALRWVLGEQSARNLRAKTMQDVLFNGSGGRKPTNFCETIVTFENTDGALGGSAEIGIGRRLFRSGESEYLINKQSCRLKDVRELFFDTGVGMDTYSVIEQGNIDAILKANPRERRRLFEEAAGIRRALQKKRESENRLKRIDDNRTRLGDILREVQRAYDSVKGKADKARRGLVLRYRKAHLSRGVLRALLDTLKADLERMDLEHVARGTEANRQQEALQKAREEVASALSARRLAERARAAASRDLAVRAEELEGQEREMRFLAKRSDELKRDLERRRASRGKESQRRENLAAEREQLEAKLSRVSAQAASSDLACQAEKTAVNEAEGALRAAQAEVRQLEEAALETFRRSSRVKNEVAAAAARQKVLEARRGRLLAKTEGLASNQQAAQEASNRCAREAEEAQVALGRVMGRLQELEGEAQEARQRHEDLADKLHAAELSEREVLSRLSVLQDMEKRGDGVGKAGNALLERGHGLHLLGRRLKPEPAHVQAVAALLGPLAEAVVCARFDDALHALAWVEEQNLGAVTVLPRTGLPAPRLDACPEGAIGLAAQLAVPAGPERRLVERLLGDALVVEDREAAARLLTDRSLPFRRFATLQGEVLSRDGQLRKAGDATGGILSRNVEKGELKAEAERLLEEKQVLAEEKRIASGEVEALQNEVDGCRADLGQKKLNVVQSRAELGRAEAELSRIGEELENVQGELDDVCCELDEASALAEERSAEATRLEQLAEQHKATVATKKDAVGGAEQLLDEARARLQRVRMQALEQRKEKDHLEESLRRTIADLEERLASAARLQDRIAETESRLQETAAALEERTRKRDKLRASLGDLGGEEEGAEARLTAAEEARVAAEALVEERRKTLEGLAAEGSAARVLMREKEVRMAQLQRKWDELEAPPEEPEEELMAEERHREKQLLARLANGEEVLKDCQKCLKSVKNALAGLGPTDPSTIAEARSHEARLTALAKEQKDLERSVRDLTQLIGQIDGEARARFEETFHQVRENFKSIFRRLFGGGRADLVLEETDLLEAGIEIFAKPPGKENRTLSLLSGGERVLTAMALLFALFEIRPSPFCVLDEVDAALDEANVDRLVGLLRSYLDRTQFLVVTHNKRTMGAADALFGVTMERSGISRPVAVRLEEVAPVGVA